METPGPHQRTLFEFRERNQVAYTDRDGSNLRNTDGQWKQNGHALLVQVNDCYAEYEARIDGDEMKGEFTNVDGARAGWTARRMRDEAAARASPR